MFGFILALGIGFQTVQAGTVGIKTVGIKSYDAIFMKAKKIDQTVTQVEKNIKNAKLNFNKAVGLSKKSTYTEGIAKLQKQAGKDISMVFRGQIPTISTTSHVPPKIKKGVQALNNALKNQVQGLKKLSTVPKQTKTLSKEIQNSIGNLQIPISTLLNIKKMKTIHNNVRRISKLPSRTKKITQTISNQLRNICKAFGKTWKKHW